MQFAPVIINDFDLLRIADTESEKVVVDLITRNFPDRGIMTGEDEGLDRPGASLR